MMHWICGMQFPPSTHYNLSSFLIRTSLITRDVLEKSKPMWCRQTSPELLVKLFCCEKLKWYQLIMFDVFQLEITAISGEEKQQNIKIKRNWSRNNNCCLMSPRVKENCLLQTWTCDHNDTSDHSSCKNPLNQKNLRENCLPSAWFG